MKQNRSIEILTCDLCGISDEEDIDEDVDNRVYNFQISDAREKQICGSCLAVIKKTIKQEKI